MKKFSRLVKWLILKNEEVYFLNEAWSMFQKNGGRLNNYIIECQASAFNAKWEREAL